MNKQMKWFIITLTLVLLILFTVFYFLKVSFFIKFLIISIFFGPGMAITYGLGNSTFDPRRHLINLFIIQSISVILVYAILRRLPTDIRFDNKILDKLTEQIHESKTNVMGVMEKISGHFTSNFGDLGFYMALTLLTFAYGPYLAAIVAYLLKVKLKRAIISIAVGAAVSIVFWWYLALGAIPFITPTSVFVVTTFLTILFIIYGWFRENSIILAISYGIMDRGTDLGKEFLADVEKVSSKGKKTLNRAIPKTRSIPHISRR